MTLNELRYIVAVARERHFGHAAAASFVSQPTLSVAVKKLEDELGVKLFERGKSEVTLTPIGERIIEQAQRVLEESDAIKQIAQQGKDPLTGQIRLGVIYTIGPYLLPHVVPLLHERAPHMPLLIEEHYTAHLAEALKQGELDVIVVSLPFSEAGVQFRLLYEEPFVVAMPADHAWTEREHITPADLAEEKVLLLGAGHCFRDQVLTLCPACHQSSRSPTGRTLEGSSLEAIRYMVASGAGVAVLPCTSVRERIDGQRLIAVRPFAEPVPKRRVGLAWRRSFPRPEAVDAIAETVRDAHIACVGYLQEQAQAAVATG